ncbi:MAG: hypothetical protein WC506_06540 [Candidatus Micrarchaeia archaeon]
MDKKNSTILSGKQLERYINSVDKAIEKSFAANKKALEYLAKR